MRRDTRHEKQSYSNFSRNTRFNNSCSTVRPYLAFLKCSLQGRIQGKEGGRRGLLALQLIPIRLIPLWLIRFWLMPFWLMPIWLNPFWLMPTLYKCPLLLIIYILHAINRPTVSMLSTEDSNFIYILNTTERL